MTEEEPLEDLYVDKDELNRKRLAKILKKYVGIDRQTGEPHFRSPFHDLSNRDKVTAYLLYRRAAEILGQLDDEQLGVGPQQISEETGVNYNTTRSILSQSDFAKKSKSQGGYVIPTVNVVPAMENLEG